MAKKPGCDCPKSAERTDPRTGRVWCKNCGKTKGYDLTRVQGK